VQTSDRDLMACSDDELMAQARSNVAGAYTTLVRRHQELVVRVAASRVRNAEVAWDIAQEVFLEVYRYLDRYQGRGKFRSFLIHVVFNRCRMAQRRLRRQERLGAQLVPNASPAVVEDSGKGLERRQQVEGAITELDDKLQELLRLRYAAELSYAEISEALRWPIGTVKVRLFRTIAHLRNALDAKRGRGGE
jgi:RNA polymerase sigma-70 factor, ECF subfamily